MDRALGAALLVCLPLAVAHAKPPDCHWCRPLATFELALEPGQGKELMREVEAGAKYYGYVLADAPITLDIHGEGADISAPECEGGDVGEKVFCSFVAESKGQVHFRVVAGEAPVKSTLEVGWNR